MNAEAQESVVVRHQHGQPEVVLQLCLLEFSKMA